MTSLITRNALACCSLLLTVVACQSMGTSSTPPLGREASQMLPLARTPIRHIVIIVQENRTLDNLFHGFPGAHTANYGMNSFGKRVPLQPVGLASPLSLSHRHTAFVVEYAGGKMNGFNLEKAWCAKHKQGKCPPRDVAAYSYVPRGDVLPYWALAEQYTFADAMFQSNEGPSFPAHQYLVSGTSAISNTSNLKAAENPSHGGSKGDGCGGGPDATVVLINQYGIENQHARPCFDRISLMALLDRAGISWRYYAYTTQASIWNAPNAVEPIWESRYYNRSVVAPSARILRDVAKGELASVTWVTPTRRESDHPGGNNGSGPSWVADVVNAIGQSQFWDSTAIFVTWDDWGGLYDHVAPHIYNSYELGFRVPLIVISPYAKRGYVSHVPHEFGSILKFTEETFGLSSLGTTDERADDLSDCFDFALKPYVFRPVAAPLPPGYFMDGNDTSGPPDDDD